MKKTKLLALFGSICLVLALVATLSGGLVLAGKPAPETVPALADEPEDEAEISFEDGVPLPPNVRPVVFLSGSDYDMGYQFYQQLVQIYGKSFLAGYQYSSFYGWPLRLSKVVHGPFTAEELAALKAYQWYIKEYAPEFIDYFRGMADGATAAGVDLTYTEVLANFTGLRSYPGTEPPGSQGEELPPKCSGFAAWGSTTKDGKLICGGSGDHECTWGITIVAFPEEGKGNNFIFSSYAGHWMTTLSGHPGMNNKGLVYVHHGAGTSGKEERGYGVPGSIGTLHTLRFADDADEALEMQLDYPARQGGLWADISGDAFDLECRDPEVVRRAGLVGETNFIYATNNTLSKELEEFQTPHPEFGLTYVPHAGWLGTGATISSMARNLEMWNLLHNYQGEVDLDFAKMMWRFPGEPPDYPTLEEAEAAYYATQGEGWHQHICDLENGQVAITLPDNGDEGLYYISQGCAARVTVPLMPHGHFYRIAPTFSFYELKLASSPEEVTEAAWDRAHYQLYYANQELRKLDYLDEGYAALDEIFNQAATEWTKGERYAADAWTTTGNESINNWGKALRAFTRCQALANQVYNSLVPPATCPKDLGLHPYTYKSFWGEWVTR